MTTPAMAQTLVQVLAPVGAANAKSRGAAGDVGRVVEFMIANDFEKNLFEIVLFIMADQFAHAALGLELALMKNRHAIAHRFDLAQFVRTEENGFPFVPEALDDFTHFHSSERVESAGRLVEDEQ